MAQEWERGQRVGVEWREKDRKTKKPHTRNTKTPCGAPGIETTLPMATKGGGKHDHTPSEPTQNPRPPGTPGNNKRKTKEKEEPERGGVVSKVE